MKFFIKLLPLLAVILSITSCTRKITVNKKLVFIGNNTSDSSKGIAYAFFNESTGELTQPTYTGKLSKANFFHPDTINNMLHFIGEVYNDIDSSSIQSIVNYSVDKSSGHITPVSNTFVHGIGPCFIEYNQDNQKILIANYVSGNICSFDYTNSKLSLEYSQQHYGTGPNENRQERPHAHSIRTAPNSDFVYSCDLGADKIMVYKFINQKLEKVDSISCFPGSGPRHIDFSPDEKIMAVVNELNCTVSTYKKDSLSIYSKEIQTIAMLPDTFDGFAKAADIHFSPDGQFLYASNRGLNSIVVYKVNNGNLKLIEIFTDNINWPRNFTVSPNGKYLLVANRDSNNISVFRRNKETGKLTFLNNNAKVESPVCVRFF